MMQRGIWGIVGAMLLCVALLMTGSPANATEVEFDGMVRVRLESRTGFQGQPAKALVFQRVQFGVRAIVSEDTEAFLQFQDARVWGFEPGTLAPGNNVDFFQAYGQWNKKYTNAKIRIRGGRQILSYGNERILGAVGWSNFGRSFDALHTRMQKGGWTGDLVLSRLRAELVRPAGEANDDLYLTYHQYAFADRDMRAEVYLMYRNDRAGNYETTPGFHFDGKSSRIKYDAEVTAMFGKRPDYSDLNALLASGQLHVRIDEQGRFSIGGGVDYLSGDDPGTADDELFNVRRIFHTGHKFYGFMDVAPTLAGRAGLIDPYIVVKLGGPSRLSGVLAGHFFSVDQPGQFTVISTGDPETDKYLGTEVDLKLFLKVATNSSISLGGAVFVPGSVLEHQDRTKNATWGYAQAILNF